MGAALGHGFSFGVWFFEDDGTVPEEVVEDLAQMASIAAEHGCRLVFENEAVCWGNTGREAADIVRRVDQPNCSLLWDPGNSARAGCAMRSRVNTPSCAISSSTCT